MTGARPDAPPSAPDPDLTAALADLLAATSGPLALGLSGGGDSLALLALARRAAPDRAFTAIVIDHALRAGSDADAARAAAMARDLGAAAVVVRLSWPGAPPRSQAGARAARYRAFTAEMRRCGASALALGHTGDDQLETVALRADAASGPYGRAGMAVRAPLPIWPEGRGLVVLRPLLAVRRAALRDWLRAAGLAWIDDPANADPRFARVRARATLAALDPAAIDAALNDIAMAGAHAAALDTAAAAALAGIEVGLQGEIALPASALDGLDEAARRRAFAALVAAGSGRAEPPAGAGLARLAGRGWATTALGGAVFGRVPGPEGGRILVRRDPGAVLGRGPRARVTPTDLPPGRPLDWDGRLRLLARAPGLAVRPGPSARTGVKLTVSSPAGVLALPEAVAAGLIEVTPLAPDMVAHVLWRSHGAAQGRETVPHAPQCDF